MTRPTSKREVERDTTAYARGGKGKMALRRRPG
jgi:hypothetical protein